MNDFMIECSSEEAQPENIRFSDIVDMNSQEFKKFCVGKNATELLSLRNLFAGTYCQLEKAKDQIIDMMLKDSKVKQDQKIKRNLEDLYKLLQDLEDKSAYIRSLLNAPLSQ